MKAINDLSRPTAGGPLGRPFSLDPMLSLGDGNQPPSVGPVGRPWRPEQPGDQVTEPDYKRTTQTRSESESDTGIPDPVIQTGSEVQTDRVNISMANVPTDSSVTPPSSDSGVHSLGEQWENMSTNSMNTGSIQTVQTFYGGDTSQVDRNNPQENRKVVFFGGTVCGKNDSMAYSTTDSQNSDIAAMSVFSDDEDGPQGELQPKILTECVSDDSIKEESNGGDRPVPDMTTAGVGANSLDPNDKEYWTKFRLLTRQAFLLDKLSESNYPDAVKELVTRSRLTIMAFNEGEVEPLEQCNEGETSDYSDAESTDSMYRSEFYHREEDYYDWHYDASPVVPGITADEVIRTDRNAENNDGQCPAFRKGNEDKPDLYSELGGRAKSELSPEEAVRKIDIFSVDYVSNDNPTVNMRDLAGVSHTDEDEVMRVSMITADVSQGNTNSHSNNSQGIQDYVQSVGNNMSCVYASTRGLEDGPVRPCDVIPVYVWMTEKFKDVLNKVMLVNKAPVNSHGLQRGGDNGQVRGTHASVDNRPIRVAGRFGCLYSPVQGADWLDVLSVGGGLVGKDVWIGYIGDGFSQYQSPDAAPLTELQDLNILLHSYSDCATGFYLIWTVSITVRISLGVEEVTSCCGELLLCQTMDGAALADDRSGVTFTAELCVPWDAPEAVVDINSTDLISLGSFPDKVGLFVRRKEAAVSRIMAGRDSRSVRFGVPDGRVVDRGYHDVTVVDMEEEREPMIVLSDMTRLRELWPVEVFDHMKWYQQDLERLRKSAKKDYQQTRPMPCRFCGKVIRVDMYRHVARLHLDLVQLWRCPIAWCTTWKGSPQDCLEHVRSGHDAPWVSKTASIEKYAPPWTVRRQLWTDSLRIEHSGISMDMLLFSEVGMPLTQHYRVYKGGLPHAVFHTDYLSRLRSLLPSPGGADTHQMTCAG